MRAAAGSTDHAKFRELQIISNGQNVFCRVRDPSMFVPTRQAVARPVITDQPNTQAIKNA